MSFEIKSPSVKDLLKRFESPRNTSTQKEINSSVPKYLEDGEASKPDVVVGTSDPDLIFKRRQVILELSNRKESSTNDRPFCSTSVTFSASTSESKPEKMISSDNERACTKATMASESSPSLNRKPSPSIEEEIEDSQVIDCIENQSPDEEMVEIEMASSFLTQNHRNESTNTEQSFKRINLSFQDSKQSIYLFLTALKRIVKDHRERFMFVCSKIPMVIKFMVFEISTSNPATIACFLALILSMVSSFYPTVPHCNVPTLSMLWIYTSVRQQNRRSVLLLSLTVLISCINDFVWLSNNSVVNSLETLEDDDVHLFELKQQESLSFQIAWYLLLLGILGKFGAWISMLRQEDLGRKIMKETWKKVYVFFPPVSMSLPEHICCEVESRIIAIVWLEFVSIISLAILTLYSHTRLFWAEQLSATVVVTSLINLLYAKIFCELLFLLSLLKNCSWAGVFSEFGCGQCFTKNTAEESKVNISLGFFRFNWVAKACALLPSCFLWISLESSFRMGGPNVPSQIRSTLYLVTTCVSLLDVYCVMLFMVTTCYSLTAKDQFPNWMTGEQNDDNYDFNNNVPSSQDLFEMRLSSAEMSNSNSLLKMDSCIECNDDQFQEYWRTFQQHVQFNYRTSRIPNINQCQEVLASNLFYTVASGYIDANIYKVFFIGKSHTALCLAQMTVNPAQRSISIILKSNKKHMLRKFTNNIPFYQLFGTVRNQYVRHN